MQSLKHHFLMAMPHLEDPNFAGSLIYLCDHDHNGCMGVIVNRPMEITLDAIGRRRLLVPVPLAAMSLGAMITGLLPNPPLTMDQVRLLAADNVVSDDARGLSDLGIAPTSVDAIIPGYLSCFRPGGQFSRRG